jgi:hypothetical protein
MAISWKPPAAIDNRREGSIRMTSLTLSRIAVRFGRATLSAFLLASVVASAQPTARRPDLSGTWLPGQFVASYGLKRQENGTVKTAVVDRSARAAPAGVVAGALPFTMAPSYKPEFQARVKELIDHQAKTDPVFYCARPGVPRIGPPRRIVQLPDEVIFFYEDMSGDTYRVVPTDGRPHDPDADPAVNGHSVAHWEGNQLVVDVRGFTDDTWFGEQGYFHTSALHVIERLWLDGNDLAYQVTIEDPNVLTAPWTNAPRIVKRSALPLEESPPCRDHDGPLLLNDDHHDQR